MSRDDTELEDDSGSTEQSEPTTDKTQVAAGVDPELPDASTLEATPSSCPDTNPEAVDELTELPLVSPDFYELISDFAQGGIGKIIEARDSRLDRIVAIKVLRRRTRYSLARFAREVRITAKLQHPSIVPIHEAGRWPNGEPFFAMKLVGGGSLEDAIDSCVEPRDRMALVRHVAAIADAMAYAHNQRVVHRDLKPSNVLVGPFGETVVIDWGLAKDLSDAEDEELPPPSRRTMTERYRTTDGAVMGTPPYMSPEQAAGNPDLDERADVYALGAILYQVLSGRTPYHEFHPRMVLDKVKALPPTPLRQLEPDLPPDLIAIVDKAMSRDAADRYPTAREMAAELQRFTSGGLVAAYHYSATELIRRFVSRHRTAVSIASLALVLLAALGAWSVVNITEQRNHAQTEHTKAVLAAKRAAQAQQQAEASRDRAILDAARSEAQHDPTKAVAHLKKLHAPIPAGAATIAADAIEQGVAEHVLSGHEDRLDVVVFSPDGKRIASAGLDKTVRLWARDDGSGRLLSGHADRIPALAYSPDGARIVSASYDGRLIVWDAERGIEEHRLEGHGAPVKAVAFSHDGERVASVGDDGVRLWDLAKGGSSAFEAPADRPMFVHFSPDDSKVLTGSHAGALRLWDVAGGQARVLDGHEGVVAHAEISPAGDAVASAGMDGTIRIWPLAEAGEPKILRADRGSVQALAFLPTGNKLVSGATDGSVMLWDLSSGEHRTIAQHQAHVTVVRVSSDGRWVASASWDNTVGLYDLHTATLMRLRGHGHVVSSLSFAADGKTLASAAWDGQVRIWQVRAGGRRRLSGHRVGVKTVAFSPDGKRLVSGGHDNMVRLWNVASGKLERTFPGHRDHVYRVLFSHDGTWLASSSDDRTARLWRVDGGASFVLEGHQADVEELAFSPDSRLLASAGEDDAIGLWWVADGKGGLLRGHQGAVTAVAFSPDGTKLASASRDKTVRLWDPAKREMVKVLTGHEGEVTGLAWSHDGDHLATAGGDGTVMMYDQDGGEGRLFAKLEGAEQVLFSPDDEQLAVTTAQSTVWRCGIHKPGCSELAGHAAQVHAMAFTRNGANLVTGSGDATIRLWNVTTGESRALRGHDASVFGVAVSPDGTLVASGSADESIRLWPVEPLPSARALPEWLNGATTYQLPHEPALAP